MTIIVQNHDHVLTIVCIWRWSRHKYLIKCIYLPVIGRVHITFIRRAIAIGPNESGCHLIPVYIRHTLLGKSLGDASQPREGWSTEL